MMQPLESETALHSAAVICQLHVRRTLFFIPMDLTVEL